MFNTEKHLDDLTRHIDLVRAACLLIGKRLIEQGRTDFGRLLIAKGYQHDVSKFYGAEWKYLHSGPDTPKDQLALAIEQHIHTNDHHPEFWGGIAEMPELSVYEMVADWYARAQEFGTGLREWYVGSAIQRFGVSPDSDVSRWIEMAMSTLLQNSFTKEPV